MDEQEILDRYSEALQRADEELGKETTLTNLWMNEQAKPLIHQKDEAIAAARHRLNAKKADAGMLRKERVDLAQQKYDGQCHVAERDFANERDALREKQRGAFAEIQTEHAKRLEAAKEKHRLAMEAIEEEKREGIKKLKAEEENMKKKDARKEEVKGE